MQFRRHSVVENKDQIRLNMHERLREITSEASPESAAAIDPSWSLSPSAKKQIKMYDFNAI